MAVARLTGVRLTAFKSFRDQTLPLHDTTILIGRNSAGKSNALDGIEVLARLAEGDDLADALDGRRREGGSVRGGSAGCAPHGMDSFTLGCDVEWDDCVYSYDVTVEVRPDLRVVAERLWGQVKAHSSGKWSEGPLFETRSPGSPGTGIIAEVHNGKRGVNPPMVFRDSRLVLTQVPLAVAGVTAAERSAVDGINAVLVALRGVFHLDPVPHLMRDFVPSRDPDLRRTGENVSAALNGLQSRDERGFANIVGLVSAIADDRIRGIDFVRSELGDVMLAIDEVVAGNTVERTPAREMSDGLLRFLAIATALVSPRLGLDVDGSLAKFVDGPDRSDEPAVEGSVLIVLEELENGLHSSQARRVLDEVRASASDLSTRVLVTTHSPAILDAAEGQLNESVVVCHRDRDSGASMLTPLMDVPGYSRALAEGSLGSAITGGKLRGSVIEVAAPDYSEFERLIGLK